MLFGFYRVSLLTLAIRNYACSTSFSYVLLRLKGFIPTVTPAPHWCDMIIAWNYATIQSLGGFLIEHNFSSGPNYFSYSNFGFDNDATK